MLTSINNSFPEEVSSMFLDAAVTGRRHYSSGALKVVLVSLAK
jgi:hypothetical protein